MANDFDESKIEWHDAPKFDESQIQWQPGEDQPKTEQGLRGDTAAFLRGVSEQIPFARDIGAAAKAYVGNPLTGERPTGDFGKSKRELERQNAQLAEEHPWSYGAGEIGGGLASIAVPEAMGANIIGRGAQAEAYAANKLAPLLRSTTEAKLVSGLGSGAVAGAAQGAIHGFGTGTDLEDRLSSATGEAIMGAPLGAAGSALGHAGSRVARKIGEWTGKVAPKAPPATSADILSNATNLYNYRDSIPIKIRSSAVKDLFNKIDSDFSTFGYMPAHPNHSVVNRAFTQLGKVGSPISIKDLNTLRSMTDEAAKDYTNKPGQALARIYRNNIRNFLDNLKPGEVIGSPVDYADAMRAHKQATVAFRTGQNLLELENAAGAAARKTARSGVGGDFDNKYRAQIGSILDRAKKLKGASTWSPEEQKAMEDFVNGGRFRNFARALGRMSPVHHPLIGAGELLAAFSHPQGMAGVAAAGMAAHKAEDYLTRKAGEELQSLARAGRNSANLPTYNPIESVRGKAVGVPMTTGPVFTPTLESPVFAEDREERASGGRLGKRDYPAKRLSRVEKAVRRAQQAIALETKPLLDQPDHVIANALDVAMNK